LLVIASVVIAFVPIVGRFEDFFVNGIRFASELQLFTGTPKKREIMLVLEAYYGRMRKTTLSWATTLKMVRNMFSHHHGYVDHTSVVTKLGFYGNDGVCLFKYFVDTEDPQKLFVWSILAVNFICFTLISTSYLAIALISQRSSQNVTNSKVNKPASDRSRKMNQRIACIITTDFLCWVPFIMICGLHSLEALDATRWYSIFSMIILPINSVLNPLIYDDTVTRLIVIPVKRVINIVSNLASLARPSTGQTIELEHIEEHTGTATAAAAEKQSDGEKTNQITGVAKENVNMKTKRQVPRESDIIEETPF
jgi:hypothetical protein